MAKYFSRYDGPEFDRAIEYILREYRLSVFHTLECSLDNKIDLNTLIYEEGVYTAQYFTNSADDNDDSAVILTVVFIDDEIILQSYELNGTEYRRFYNSTTSEFTDWMAVQPFIIAQPDDEVVVPRPTLILRNYNNIDVDTIV